ncbi:hypothetical protein OS176_05715 [Xanthomonadaceae bacterium XH05]|nr:hypothetical protein [Xanthomonadaceae bacterium XH05]
MFTASGAQDSGFDVWLRPFRDALAAFQPAAFSGAGAMPGMGTWPGAGWMPGATTSAGFPGMSAWPGQTVGGFVPGMTAPGMAGPFAAMFEQLSALAQGQWQQFAGHVGGEAGNATDAMSQWRHALEGMVPAANAAFDVSAMRGMDKQALRDSLSTPPVGPLREHVQRWQQAVLAHLDHQEAAQAFSAQLGEIMKLALTYYERRLAARVESGQPQVSMRALFDEWIEAGEQAWAERAGSDAFVTAFGHYTNTQMRVRAAMDDQINRVAESLGLPTRVEVESDHRRIAMLERELRRIRDELDQLQRGPAQVPAAPAAAEKPRVVPIRPDLAVAAETAPAKSRRAKAAKTSKAGKNASGKTAPRPGKRGKPAKPERSSVSATVLPIVAAPRAIGGAGKVARDEAAPRRRAGK